MQKLRYHRPGTAPATLVAPPEQAGHKPIIKLIEYDAHSLEEHEVENVEEVFKCLVNLIWATSTGSTQLHVLITPAVMKRCYWVEPLLAAQVKFTEWTSDDQLRQPVFLGLRTDKKPQQVVRE